MYLAINPPPPSSNAAHPPTMVLGGWVGWLLTHSFGVSILPRAFVGLWLFATTKAEKEERKSMDCMRGEELCKRGNNNNNNGSRPQTEAFLSLSSFHSIQPSLFFWQIYIQKEQNRSDYESISGKPQPWHLFFKSFHQKPNERKRRFISLRSLILTRDDDILCTFSISPDVTGKNVTEITFFIGKESRYT